MDQMREVVVDYNHIEQADDGRESRVGVRGLQSTLNGPDFMASLAALIRSR
jgi:hypothetical protein